MLMSNSHLNEACSLLLQGSLDSRLQGEMRASGAEFIEEALKWRGMTVSSMQWRSSPEKLNLQKKWSLNSQLWDHSSNDRGWAAVLWHHTCP